jgi:ADP-L-glycero-D-manno-heptose 6-epimerase
MLIVTGGAGFIGSALVWKLNELGREDLLIVDRMGSGGKWKNLGKRRFTTIIHKDQLLPWLAGDGAKAKVEAVVHMGASSSTTEADVDYLMANNLNYSIALWSYCAARRIPFIYASSASTYGAGDQGFDDAPEGNGDLRPMHPYGFSKHRFDSWVLQQVAAGAPQPPLWAGLRFFNVYGPQEYHKGSQGSVVFHFVPQVRESGAIRLFKSYKPGVADGQQSRDFVYVKDCVEVMTHFLCNGAAARSGIYNIGTGKARTFADMARAIFGAMAKPEKLSFIPMPDNLRDQYQYFTEATLANLRERGGYKRAFTSLEDGVRDYVCNYLLTSDPFL